MGAMTTSERITFPHMIGDRYQVYQQVGKGGMAVVYRALDTKMGKEVALKQMRFNSEKADQQKLHELETLFEHEFYILAQLAHPRVIDVYDYGKSSSGSYYTMELLDGGDIRELAPLPYKQACEVFIDICSVLGMLHSRHQLHRDLSPLNIRCTRDGKAKLIDFGAMTPFGPCKRVVGTPPFTPPEVVGLQTTDARSDIYSLGATLYFALTGRMAFHASNFRELHQAWLSKPFPPSHIVADIPKELDELVLSMVSLDFVARPLNVAVVMEKLSAIADIEIREELLVEQGYLSKPNLLCREEQLLPVRKQIVHALRGKGGAFIIEGSAGTGRSRLLDAYTLEGRLAGITVLRADSSDSYAGDWGVVRTLAVQLVDALPEIAAKNAQPHTALLETILPNINEQLEAIDKTDRYSTEYRIEPVAAKRESSSVDNFAEARVLTVSARPMISLVGQSYRPAPEPNPQLRPQLLKALHDWWLNTSRERCLMIAVDDIHRIDEPSAAFLALISQDVPSTMTILATTCETNATSDYQVAIKQIKKISTKVQLGNLRADNTEKLIESVFGTVSNLKVVASSVQAISKGNPRAIMQLLQHLVDNKVIQYHAGAWQLPSAIDPTDLPSSLNGALAAVVAKLSPAALHLAQAMAFNPEQLFSYEKCQLLAEKRETAELLQILAELVSAEILATDTYDYWFSQPSWGNVLLDKLDERDKTALHLRLAEMFEKYGNDQFRVGQHLLRAGEEERAIDVLIDFSQRTKAMTARDPGVYSELLQMLPSDWYDTFDTVIALSEKRGRPLNHVNIMQSRVSGIFGVTGSIQTDHTTRVLERYYRESGLRYYQEIGDQVPAAQRIGRALQMAQQHYDSCLDTERILPPSDAIRALAATLIEAIGIVYISDSFSFWRTLPSIEALVPLSPAVGIVEKCREAIGHCVAGRVEVFHRLYIEVLERLEQPDKAQLEGAHYQWLRIAVIHAIAVTEAIMGIDSVENRIFEIESFPLLQVNAWRIRKVYHLWQGNSQEAEKCQRQVELLQIANNPTRYYQGTKLCAELRAYCCAEDLSGIKQVMDDLRRMASRFPNWMAVVHYAQGEYHRIRGDYRRALKELEAAFQFAQPGRNQNWPYIANAYLRTLNALGAYQRAEEEGRRLISLADEHKLDFKRNFLLMPLAEAEAKNGKSTEAIATSDAAIEGFRSFGTTGLSLGLAYESRARVATILKDHQAFEVNASCCAEQYKNGINPVLSSKFEKLMYHAGIAKVGVSIALDSRSADAPSEIISVLESCSSAVERAERALNILIKVTDSVGGFLYTLQDKGPVLIARDGKYVPPAEMDTLVKLRMTDEIEGTADMTAATADMEKPQLDTADWAVALGSEYRSIVLGHYEEEGFALTGLAVLVVDPCKEFKRPIDTAQAISRSLLDAGDVARVFSMR